MVQLGGFLPILKKPFKDAMQIANIVDSLASGKSILVTNLDTENNLFNNKTKNPSSSFKRLN